MLPFSQVDVFTDRLTLGNPVAVVHDADDLDDAQMAAFARWTNLSETTFLLAPRTPEADYRLRIFTPARELPFAGHPTLGSARAWLERGGRPNTRDELVQECAAGLIRIRKVKSRWAFAAPPLLRSGPVSSTDLLELAARLRLQLDQIVDAQWADNGPGWIAVLLRSAGEVLAMEPGLPLSGEFLDVGVVGPWPMGSETQFEVRAFTAVPSVPEDPVTGSLNAALGQWLIPAGYAPESYVAAQGTRLGRRGRVHVNRVDDRIWVGGDTVLGVEGEVALVPRRG